MSYDQWIGSIGVAALLLAFALNGFGFVRHDSPRYQLLNVIGAGLACYASWLIHYVPFVVLEGTWCLVATFGLVRVLRSGSPTSRGVSAMP